MKRILGLSVLCVLSVFCVKPLWAVPVGTILVEEKENALLPVQFTTGYGLIDGSGDRDEKGQFYFEKISFTGIKSGDIRPYISAKRTRSRIVDSDSENNLAPIDVNQKNDWSNIYGIGVDFIVYEHVEWYLRVFGHVGYEFGKIETRETIAGAFVNSSEELDFEQWRASLGVAKTFDFPNGWLLTPYAGVGYVHTETEKANAFAQYFPDTSDEWEAFVGLNFDLGNGYALLVEGLFRDDVQEISSAFSAQF